MIIENDFFIFKKLFHIFIKKGKKIKALNVVLNALRNLKYKKKIKLSSHQIVYKSFKNVRPLLYIKKVKRASKVFYVPKIITTEQKISLSIHWMLKSINSRKEKKLEERLEKEFLDCFLGKGSTVKKKQALYDTILVNRPFLNLLTHK